MNRIFQMLALIFCCSFCFVPDAVAQTTSEITKGNCKACADECRKCAGNCSKVKGGAT
jgi:hypothetical protein